MGGLQLCSVEKAVVTRNTFGALENDDDDGDHDTPGRGESGAGSGQIERIPPGPCNRGGNAAAPTNNRRHQSSVREADLVDFMLEEKMAEVMEYADEVKIEAGQAAEELVEEYVMTGRVTTLIDEYTKSKEFPSPMQSAMAGQDKAKAMPRARGRWTRMHEMEKGLGHCAREPEAPRGNLVIKESVKESRVRWRVPADEAAVPKLHEVEQAAGRSTQRPMIGNFGWQEWEPMPMGITIDSGAAETVIPEHVGSQYARVATMASESGLEYQSATGQPIRNLGEKKLNLMINDGSMRQMTMQVAEKVSKPLGSVSRICAAGHRVVFDDDGSYIEHKVTGQTSWLRQENGVYVLDAWIAPPKQDQSSGGESGFTRQGGSR